MCFKNLIRTMFVLLFLQQIVSLIPCCCFSFNVSEYATNVKKNYPEMDADNVKVI